MLEDVFDYIDDRTKELLDTEYRPGFYIAKVTNALQTLRRAQLTPEWMDEGALEQARRISSPLLDVIPAVGTRMATLSQDGVPEYPAWVGKIWDDEGPVSAMTAWLRANLEEHPGHVELGAEDGIRIKVGANTEQIDETADGEVVVESEDGNNRLRLKPDGTVLVESSTGDNRMKLKPDGEVDVESSTGGNRLRLKKNGAVVVESSDIRLGDASPDQPVALAGKVFSELDEIKKKLNAIIGVYSDAWDKSAGNSPPTDEEMIVNADQSKAEPDPDITKYTPTTPNSSKVQAD